MADTKTTGLTENTSPLSTDMLYMIDDPGGSPASQKITVANLMTLAPIVLTGGFASVNPADATTYTFGTFSHVTPDATGATSRRIYMPRAGIITKVDAWFYLTGAGSSETSTLYLRKNNTTDSTITSAINLAASYHELKTGLNITVAAGDYFEFKWVSPTWGTNPTGVNAACQIFLA